MVYVVGVNGCGRCQSACARRSPKCYSVSSMTSRVRFRSWPAPAVRWAVTLTSLCIVTFATACAQGSSGDSGGPESDPTQEAHTSGTATVTVDGGPISSLDTAAVECTQETPSRARIVIGTPANTRVGLTVENESAAGYDHYTGALVAISPNLDQLGFAEDPRRQIDGGSTQYTYDSNSATFGFTGLVEWSNGEGLGMPDGQYEISAVCPGLTIPVLGAE